MIRSLDYYEPKKKKEKEDKENSYSFYCKKTLQREKNDYYGISNWYIFTTLSTSSIPLLSFQDKKWTKKKRQKSSVSKFNKIIIEK